MNEYQDFRRMQDGDDSSARDGAQEQGSGIAAAADGRRPRLLLDSLLYDSSVAAPTYAEIDLGNGQVARSDDRWEMRAAGRGVPPVGVKVDLGDGRIAEPGV